MDNNGKETIGSPTPEPDAGLNRDPEDWVTGDEPMTAAQRSYLDTLAREAGEELPADLSKAEASKHIDRLQQRSGRVSGDGDDAGSQAPAQ
ncbi:DUF3072 domain-containing protein [Pseudarthrobacter sp. NPDC089323]|jgi:hypothetical protein